MPHRRHSLNRPDRQRRRSHHDHNKKSYFNDYQGRASWNRDYQFDRDPISFESDMKSRSEHDRWQGRASPQDMGYNYQGSPNRENYWNPSQHEVSWGSEGRGLNTNPSVFGGYRTANAPGSYQGHGIDVGPNYQSTESYRNASAKADYGTYEGSGSGYGAEMGSSGSGYGSYEGTAGSNYGNYESTNPPHRGSRGSTEDWRTHQSARQSMGSGYGPTQDAQQRVNPGFQQDLSSSENRFNRKNDFRTYEGIGATDQYEGLATGFSGPFREDLPSSRGLHHGKGPKGYRRSDERIKDDVCYALMLSPDVDASHIEVEVSQGVITLNGTVPDRRMKRMAEDCIDNVQGVTDVHNQLKVTPASENIASGEPSAAMRASAGAGESDFTQDSKSRSKNQKS